MPTSIKTNVKINPVALLNKPQLACYVAVISTQWANIEDELALVFAFALRTPTPLATMALGRVNSLAARLDMIRAALAHSVSIKASTDFSKACKEIRKCAAVRADLVHCLWTTHEDYPDALIRIRGLSDPQLEMLAYEEKDFAEIALRMEQLLLTVKEFSTSLPDERAREAPKRSAWQHKIEVEDQGADRLAEPGQLVHQNGSNEQCPVRS